MNTPRLALAITAIAFCSTPLGGCVTVFPKSPQASLYRFEPDPAPKPGPARAGTVTTVALGEQSFRSEEAGDRLAVIEGGQLAYVADARWAAPAEVLFIDAVLETFDAQAGATRLVRRGGLAASPYLLGLQVDRFEAVRPAADGAPPTVVVRFRALLIRTKDRALIGDRTFESSAPAKANRLSAIVPAYDAALSTTLSTLTSWVDDQIAGQAAG
ncbi:MAG TPA: ABC-type transport auxiliary lipoprotein family protein [Caulobacteraceae bacterium]|nr:ABC-type transport auxiliary lipoprotein family protein [Caulobacteraceae bacterium]